MLMMSDESERESEDEDETQWLARGRKAWMNEKVGEEEVLVDLMGVVEVTSSLSLA